MGAGWNFSAFLRGRSDSSKEKNASDGANRENDLSTFFICVSISGARASFPREFLGRRRELFCGGRDYQRKLAIDESTFFHVTTPFVVVEKRRVILQTYINLSGEKGEDRP